MNKKDHLYQTYINILKEELIPAMGCTEPIAIAYGAAKAREVSLFLIRSILKVFLLRRRQES